MVYVVALDRPVPADDDAHHLSRVLRLRPGEPVVAGDGRGSWRLCRFRGPSRGSGPSTAKEQLLEVDGAVVVGIRPVPLLTIGFVPVKGDRLEWVVQKLTEA